MKLVPALIACAFLLSLAVGSAQAADSDLAAQIPAATAEQHQTLAQEYRAQAAKSRERAALHKRMAERYKQGKPVLDQSGHCASIASREEQNAADYEALATAEEAAAKQ